MNPFRQLLKSAGAHPPVGTWIMSASPLVAEATGHAGFDWAVIDMEHSPLDMMDVLQMMQCGEHLDEVGLRRIAAVTQQMNRRQRSRYLESSEAIRQPSRSDIETKIWS